jgi:hypothetical protein
MEIENRIYKKNKYISKLSVDISKWKKIAMNYALLNKKKD